MNEKNEKYFNKNKLFILYMNFKRVDNKKEYYKILYNEICEFLGCFIYFYISN